MDTAASNEPVVKVEPLEAAPSTESSAEAEPLSDTKPSLEEMLVEWFKRTAPVDTAAPSTEAEQPSDVT